MLLRRFNLFVLTDLLLPAMNNFTAFQPYNIPTKKTLQQYTLVINGKPEGPFSTDELKARGIRPGDFVRTDDMPDYKEAQEVPELRELLGLKKPPLLIQYYGSFDQRLLATAIDWFMMLAIGILGVCFTGFFVRDKETLIMVAIGIAAVLPVVKMIYQIIMECSSKQGTLGKMILKIQVCDEYGDRLSFGRSLGRSLAKIFSTALVFAGYLVCFIDKKHQCLHDKIADTLVIKDRLL